MGYHAKRSPSSAKVWTDCTASIDAQHGLPDDGSEAARLGTCQHQLSAECLEQGTDPQSYLGRKMLFWIHPESDSNGEDWEDVFTDEFGEFGYDPSMVFVHEVVVDQDMIDASVMYINFVNHIASTSGDKMHVEKRVPIGHITGEARDGSPLADRPAATDDEEAAGTADVILVGRTVLTTVDAKFGRGKIQAFDVLAPAREDIITGEDVPAVIKMNLQLALYLLGSLRKYGHEGITHVKAIIVQPYLQHVSEYSCTVEELLALGEWIKERAESGRTNPVFSPTFTNCMFCRARFTCTARETLALETALEGFEDVDTATARRIKPNELGSVYAKVEFIMDWCKDVQTRVYEDLKAGRPVMRNDGLAYKLVAGKKGVRQWSDEAEAVKLLKRMRLKNEQIYVSHLAGPAVIEKLTHAKKVKKGEQPVAPLLGETQWKRLSALISQADGNASVALETDPRPAIGAAVDGFEDVADDCDDLF